MFRAERAYGLLRDHRATLERAGLDFCAAPRAARRRSGLSLALILRGREESTQRWKTPKRRYQSVQRAAVASLHVLEECRGLTRIGGTLPKALLQREAKQTRPPAQGTDSSPPSGSPSAISSASSVVPNAAPSGRERPGRMMNNTRYTSRPLAVEQHPHLLAVDLGIRVDRAALRVRHQRRDLCPEVRASARPSPRTPTGRESSVPRA